jgi:hypothetical protein
MIPFNEIKMGDYVSASYNNKLWEGQVAGINNDEKQICVATEVQEFWFEPENLFPLPLNEDQLLKLNFSKMEYDDTGEVKYSKGAFRLIIPSENDFSSVEMWYREDRRHHPDVHYIHQLQNHFHQMTKVPLAR